MFQSCSQFVNEQLSSHFQHLHNFVTQLRSEFGIDDSSKSQQEVNAELLALVESSSMPTLSRKLTGSVEKVITTFAASWKNALRDTDKEIVQLFSNYRQVGFSHEVSWLVNSYHWSPSLP